MELSSFLPKSGKILEVGPLDNPFVKRPEHDVYYADVYTTEKVKEMYENSYANFDRIVDIDFAIGSGSYREAVGDNKFAAVYSSHCVEHIPDIIRHFIDISEILEDGGRYILRIPDKRNSFDYYRNVTPFRDAYDIYLNGGKGVNRLYADSLMLTSTYSEAGATTWFYNNRASYLLDLLNDGRIEMARELFAEEDATKRVSTAHIWVFDYETALAFFRDCLRFNLFPFSVENHSSNISEVSYDIEIVLRKDVRIKTDEKLRQREIVKVQLAIEAERNIECKFHDAIGVGINKYKFWIYGAGIEGRRCYDNLINCGVMVKGFLISDNQEMINDNVCGKSVRFISDFQRTENDVVVVAVGNKYYAEIKDVLIRCGMELYKDFFRM